MKAIKFKYNFVNIVVILIAAIIFFYAYKNMDLIFQKSSIIRILIALVTVFFVHIIKAGRLYLALYGSGINRKSYLKVYCKVTPISMIIPYKLGEFYRMYCYGQAVGNAIRGIVIVILDRFMDTIALVTIILFLWIFGGGYITSLVYILLLFLITVLIAFFVFPGMYKFWKTYMLRADATEKKLIILKVLNGMNHVYGEIQSVSRGRGIVLYFMSLVAWAVEICGVIFQTKFLGCGNKNTDVADYLKAALGGNSSEELKLFVFFSVVVLIIIYFILKLVDWLQRKAVQNESNSSI